MSKVSGLQPQQDIFQPLLAKTEMKSLNVGTLCSHSQCKLQRTKLALAENEFWGLGVCSRVSRGLNNKLDCYDVMKKWQIIQDLIF